jgi:phosphoenolpyruvate synthase/pyruvate phosphate dikinase
MQYIVPFRELDIGRVAEVGGKNASLGELITALTRSP